jgi:hypothetical protein
MIRRIVKAVEVIKEHRNHSQRDSPVSTMVIKNVVNKITDIDIVQNKCCLGPNTDKAK